MSSLRRDSDRWRPPTTARHWDLIDRYEADAAFNGLDYDRHGEEAAIQVFAGAIVRAGAEFLADPLESTFIPSWSRVRSEIPDMAERLVAAVEADTAS